MLDVWLHARRVGTLRVKPNGNMQFRYDEDYAADADAPALSRNLPVRERGYSHRDCLSFFGGLLPEEAVREQVARTLRISQSNDYSLLESLGGDCAGAVTLLPEGTELTPPTQGDLDELTEERLAQVLGDLPQRPLAVDPSGDVRLSLAGAQSKVPVIEFEPGRFALPKSAGAATTHILKPEPERFPGLVANECFCMNLATEVGLAAAPVTHDKTSAGLPYLIVSRYDRDLTQHPIRRLHQEDICQALGTLPQNKYQKEGGPSVKEAMNLLQDSAIPAQDRNQFWSAVVFNVLIGNCDAHGKNFSLLYDSSAPHLAPLYDLVSTAAYDELTLELAMALNGARTLGDVDQRSLGRLAQQVGLSELYAQRRVEELAAKTIAAADVVRARSEHTHPVVDEICAGIQRRAADKLTAG